MSDGAADGTGEGESGVELSARKLGGLLLGLGGHFLCVFGYRERKRRNEWSGGFLTRRKVKKAQVN